MFEILKGGYYISKQFNACRGIGREVTYYELELSTTSKSRSFFDDSEYERTIGNVFLGKPGEIRKSIGNFECYYLHFNCNDKEFEEKYLKSVPDFMYSYDYMELKNTIEECVMLHEKCGWDKRFEKEYGILIDSMLENLFVKLYLKTALVSVENTNYNENVTKACKFIEENFRKSINADDIAHAALLSTSFLYVCFKKETGQTPHEYITEKRLEYAGQQLIFSKKPVTVISEECGFSSSNYLNRIFLKKYNMTPLQYRKKFKKD